MKQFRLITFAAALVVSLSSIANSAPKNDVLYQTSTIDALMKGLYDGEVSFKDLKLHGDTGIGTVTTLDGELIGFDDRFYQIKSDGKAYQVTDTMSTPFASVKFFQPDASAQIDQPKDMAAIQSLIDSQISSKNYFYAIRIQGTFDYVKTRSVPSQTKPYPPLVQVVQKQPTFEFKNVKGTIIGFRCPDYVKGVNVPGYHLHFLNADKTSGGHVLDFKVTGGTLQLDSTQQFYLDLPSTSEFKTLDLSEHKADDLKRVESDNK